MKEYLLIFRGGDGREAQLDKEKWAQHMELWKKWMGGLAEAGKFIGGQPLVGDGRTMHTVDNITDAPFAEGKEVVNGYLIIKGKNYDEAVELSKGCPIFEHNGIVEVREIASMDNM